MGKDSKKKVELSEPLLDKDGNEIQFWRTGLFHCEMKTCLATFFIPCYNYALVNQNLGEGICFKTPNFTPNCVCYTLSTVLYPAQVVLTTIQHEKVRRKYNIAGSACCSCVLATFCPCCTLNQNMNELRVRGDLHEA